MTKSRAVEILINGEENVSQQADKASTSLKQLRSESESRAVRVLIDAQENVTHEVARASSALDQFRAKIDALPVTIIGTTIGTAAGNLLGHGFRSFISGAKDAAFSVVKLTADMEQAEIAFGTMLGGASKAKNLLSDLREFAVESPFDFSNLRDSTRKLIAYGFEQEEVLDTLRMVGDVASGLTQPLGELASIYGKARVQGRLYGNDIVQLGDRGIPILEELSKQLNVSTREVTKLVSEGKVGFNELEKVFVSMTSEGGKFHGMMAKQAQSVSGYWEGTLDNLDEIKLTLGQWLLPGFKMVAILTGDITNNIKDWAAATQTEGSSVLEYIDGVSYRVAFLIDMWDMVRVAFDYVQRDLITKLKTVVHAVEKLFWALNQIPGRAGDTFAKPLAYLEAYTDELEATVQRSTDAIDKYHNSLSRGDQLLEYYKGLRQTTVESMKGVADRVKAEPTLAEAFWNTGEKMAESLAGGIKKGFEHVRPDLLQMVFGREVDQEKSVSELTSSIFEAIVQQRRDLEQSLRQEAEQLRQRNLTAEEQYEQGIKHAQALHALEKITDDEFAREANRLKGILDQATKSTDQPRSAPMVESRFLTRAPGVTDPLRQVGTNTGKMAAAIEKHTQYLADLPTVKSLLAQLTRDGTIVLKHGATT